MVEARISIPETSVADFCRRWKVTELSLFGSVLRDDFGPDSGVDVLVSFADDAHWTLLDLVRTEEELAAIVGRKVDLVERAAVARSENYIRRKRILREAEVVYGTR